MTQQILTGTIDPTQFTIEQNQDRTFCIRDNEGRKIERTIYGPMFTGKRASIFKTYRQSEIYLHRQAGLV